MIYYYYKRTCAKRRTLQDLIVRYQATRNSQSEQTITNLSEPTAMASSIWHTPSTLTGFSDELSTSCTKNPLISSAHQNVRKKDSIIILPYGFATSTPKRPL